MLTIIISIILFGLLIGVHEFGHLISAKLNKIKVTEFSIGMGPKILSFDKGETLYSLRILPIGGFCNMVGEIKESDDEGSFSSKSPLQKISVLVSGAFMNLFLGLIALIIVTSSSATYTSTYVKNVNISAPCYHQGLKSGDKIVKLNNNKIHTINDINYFMSENRGEDLTVDILRENEKLTLNIKPYYDEGRYYIGFQPLTADNNIFLSIKNSFYNEIFIVKVILKSLGQLITGDVSLNQTSGPVGVVKEIGNAAKDGFNNVMYILAIITINLGLFNLLPIPALDGGRILICLIELISRKKVSIKIEAVINAFGLILLLMLMVFVTFNDILKLFN